MNCDVPDCEADVVHEFARIESRQCVQVGHYCDTHAPEHIEEFNSKPFVGTAAPYSLPSIVNVDLRLILFQTAVLEYSTCIYLHEVSGGRWFTTFVGRDAYYSLMAAMGAYDPPCPFPQWGWVATIKEFGGYVKDVIISPASDGTRSFHAKVRILNDERLIEIDSRASDAYIIAIITCVPIFASESMLEE